LKLHREQVIHLLVLGGYQLAASQPEQARSAYHAAAQLAAERQLSLQHAQAELGLGMLDAVLELLPAARVGHIGLQRDESTAVASQYYAKLPNNLPSSYVVLVDPMLATGGSAIAALDVLKAAGATNIKIVCIVAAPEGIALVERSHPDVEIYTPVIDRELNAQKYILPGLGDFGDRLYGTC